MEDELRRELLSLNDNMKEICNIRSEPTKSFTKLEDLTDLDIIYSILGRTMPNILNYSHIPEFKRERALYTQYIDDISEVANQGWTPDFTNNKQYKYFPYFRTVFSGWVFFAVYSRSVDSGLGSGFYFKDEATAKYIGQTFVSIYSKIL